MPTPERVAFWNHKSNARKRGLKFEFTFEQWCDWWSSHLGPNWFEKRGCKRGQYVMARKKDAGHYVASNVECITTTRNNQDQAVNGLCGFKSGHTVLGNHKPHQTGIKINGATAKAIYLQQGTQRSIAKEHRVSERLVRLIKNKQVWQAFLP